MASRVVSVVVKLMTLFLRRKTSDGVQIADRQTIFQDAWYRKCNIWTNSGIELQTSLNLGDKFLREAIFSRLRHQWVRRRPVIRRVA